jgi:hydroxymethylglutaryl-CoA lyase
MRLYINDVGVRDGFQIEKRFVPTATKIELVNQLSRTGLHKIEVTSFVSARAVPALADAQEVLAGIERVPGVVYVALIPNVRGAQNAAAAARKPDEVNAVISASETHNRANINRTHAESLEELPAMVRVAHAAGMKITVSLSTTFGCPFEGHVSEDVVCSFVGRFHEMGFDGISLADTTGMANPRQVRSLTARVLERFPPHNETFYTLHFHNTRGMGLANVLAAAQSGIVRFDGSLGGLGGCPYAPGASGNISSEDAIHMLEAMGYDTGMDLPRLLQVARALPAIVGHEVPGQVAKAGLSTELHPVPAAVTELRATMA